MMRLQRVLAQALELVSSYGERSFLIKAFTAKSAAEDFQKITQEISHCVADLNLEVTISLVDAQRDAADDRHDVEELAALLEQFMRDARDAHAELVAKLSQVDEQAAARHREVMNSLMRIEDRTAQILT